MLRAPVQSHEAGTCVIVRRDGALAVAGEAIVIGGGRETGGASIAHLGGQPIARLADPCVLAQIEHETAR